MAKSEFENSLFCVMLENTLTDFDRLILSKLYEPIVGYDAVELYSNMLLTCKAGSRESEPDKGQMLLDLVHMDEAKFNLERKKLEAIGLMKTYFKDNLFIFVMNRVPTAYEFFQNNDLVFILESFVGAEAVQELNFDLLIRKFDLNNFQDITTKFDELYTKGEANHYYEGVNTENIGILIRNDNFDLDRFSSLIKNDDIFDLNDKDNKEFFFYASRLSFLYSLDTKELYDAARLSIGDDLRIDFSRFNKEVRKAYDKKHTKTTFIVEENSNDRIIHTLESITPADVYRAKTKMALTASEIDQFDRLLKDTGISLGILNVCIVYVIDQKNGEVPSYNYFLKIINNMLRAGVKSTRDAYEYINRPKTSKKKVVKEVPDWYKERYQEPKEEKKVDNNQPKDERLVDLEAFFRSREGDKNE